MSALAMRISMASGAKFDKVLSAIDKMIKELEDEDKQDGSDKGDCETDREADTKEAAEHSRSIDDLSDAISKLEDEIEEIVKEVKEKNESIDNLEKEIKEAKRIRKEENADWKQSDADDTGAIKLIVKSRDVLKNFYKETFSLLQAPGEAPKEAPKTWGGDYGGAQKEQTGIVGILDLIKQDMEKDQKSAKTAEDNSQKEHDKFVKESEGSIKELEGAINKLESSKSSKEKDITAKKGTKDNKKGSLDTVVEKMKKAAPGCDFLLVNFKVRAANRKLEISGLKKAKGILEAKNK